MVRRAATLLIMAALAACGPSTPVPAAVASSAAPQALPARAAMFGDPERELAAISPDGKWLSYIDRREDKRTLIAAPLADRVDARRIAEGAVEYFWSADGAFMIYRALEDGAWRAVDLLATGRQRLLANAGARPFPVSAALAWNVAFRIANGDVVEIDLRSGAQVSVFRNRDGYDAIFLDAYNEPALGVRQSADGATLFALAARPRKLTAPADARPLALAPDGKSALIFSSRGRKHAALLRLDMTSGESTVLAANDSGDVEQVWRAPGGGQIDAFSVAGVEPLWMALNTDASEDIALLKQNMPGFEIVSRSADNTRWIVRERAPIVAPRLWLYDRAAKKAERLFSEHPPLDGAALIKPRSVRIANAKGETEKALVYEPRAQAVNGALIVLARGGAGPPDTFKTDAQYFVSLGYPVLEAPMGGAVSLADASRWAIGQHLAAEGLKIALVGDRAAIAALPLDGNYGCAAIADSTPFASAPASTGAEKIFYARLGGAPGKRAGFSAEGIFPDEAQGFARSENRIAFYALAADFIAGCLGAAPIAIGADLENSSVQILNGQKLFPSLAAARAPRETEAGAPP